MNRFYFFVTFFCVLAVELGLRAVFTSGAFLVPIFFSVAFAMSNDALKLWGSFTIAALLYDFFSPFSFVVITALILTVGLTSVFFRSVVSIDTEHFLSVFPISLLCVIEYVFLLAVPSTLDSSVAFLFPAALLGCLTIPIFYAIIKRLHVRHETLPY